MEKEKEYMWIDKSLAKKLKDAESIEAKEEVIIGYVKNMESEFISDLEVMDETILQMKATFSKVRQEFKKACDEQIEKSYKVWEAYDLKLPKVNKYVEKVCSQITPIQKKLDDIDERARKINLYGVDKLVDVLARINGLPETQQNVLHKILLGEGENGK